MQMPIKVAVLMLGNMRSFNVTTKNLDNYLFKLYNCDLYVMTYDKRFNSKYSDSVKEEIITEDAIRNQYGQYIKHITIIGQDRFLEHYDKIIDKKYAFGDLLDRLYTIQKLSMTAYDIFNGECVRNNRKYDVIIKIRPDILIKDRFILNTTLNDHQIIIPANDSGGCFNDHIAYGRPNVMKKYFTYYRKFKEMDESNACDVSIVESGLRKHLENEHVEIIRDPIKYDIIRDIKVQKIVFAGTGRKNYFVRKY